MLARICCWQTASKAAVRTGFPFRAANSQQPAASSREQAAGSREQAAAGRQQAANTPHGPNSRNNAEEKEGWQRLEKENGCCCDTTGNARGDLIVDLIVS